MHACMLGGTFISVLLWLFLLVLCAQDLCNDGVTSLVLISLLNTCSCSVESTNARSINKRGKNSLCSPLLLNWLKKSYSKISTFKSERQNGVQSFFNSSSATQV